MLNYLEIAKQALIKHTDKGERRPKYDVFNELNEFDNAPRVNQSTGRLRDGEPEIRDLIKRLQAGHQWLLEQHRLWQTNDSTAASDSEFSRVWNGWWELDDRLRDEHGFQDCVYGPAGECPDGFPCRGCSDLPAPAVVAQLELT